MGTLRAISLRLKSVKNIQKITKSMKMVSAAKYARAERELKTARPLGEKTAKIFERPDAPKEPPESKVKRNLVYVAVTSDRGLCGAVHTSVGRHVRNTITKSSDVVKIVCIGDKGRSILQRQFGSHFLFCCTEIGRLPPTFLDACRIANEILLSEHRFDAAKIVFNRFRSVVSYVTSEMPLYHMQSVLASGLLEQYENADEETVESFVEFSMANLLFYALKESACSEQSARMTAMDNASKNASEMIGQLTLAFNRTRQAVITRELIEIISGASAL